jgi:membrane protein
MMRKIVHVLRQTINGFFEDEALTRGAAISFYAVTSIAPLLLIVVAIAGLASGREAAQGAIVGQLSGLMGAQTAEFFQSILANASSKTSGILSTLIGLVTLVITASGVFVEMQSALNAIWKVETKASTISRLLRARALSISLVVALGFLLMVSLVVSAVLAAFGDYLSATLPISGLIISILNSLISFLLIAVLFGAIFKVLPDRRLEWRDVLTGAIVTSLLFSVGKFLIALYLGSSGAASAYGAAGAIILLLLWVYYSVQIFLIGAEFTRAFATTYGSRVDQPVQPKAVVI